MATRKPTAAPAARDTADTEQTLAPTVPPVDDPSAIKDPATWVTGAEPMTGAQESYVHTLARQAGEEEELSDDMTKAEASEKIEELQAKTGRGSRGPKGPTNPPGSKPAKTSTRVAKPAAAKKPAARAKKAAE